MHGHVLPLLAEVLRQQCLLYAAGDVQLLVEGGLLAFGIQQGARIAHGAPDDVAHQGQTGNHQQQEREGEGTQTAVDLAVAAHHGHLPALFALHGSVEDILLLAGLVCQGGLSALSLHHLPVDVARSGVPALGGHFLDGLPEHEALHRTGHQVARARDDDIIARRIDVIGIDDLRQPVERYVGAQQGHRLPRPVADGIQIGAEHRLGALTVEVGVAPVAAARSHRGPVPRAVQVVVVGIAQLHLLYPAPPLHHVGLIPAALLRIVVGLEEHCRPHDVPAPRQQVAQHGVERVGLTKRALHHPRAVAGTGLHRRHHLLDFQALHVELGLRTVFHLLADALAREPIHRQRRQFDKHGGHDD